MIQSNKIRISASISEELIDWINEKIKERKFANRSHALEYSIQMVINQEKKGLLKL